MTEESQSYELTGNEAALIVTLLIESQCASQPPVGWTWDEIEALLQKFRDKRA